ncbi:MAG: EAL domain-containing protein [Clostridia bacterium]|nr:EAL domain-containing protein [Clostridia bacterium]
MKNTLSVMHIDDFQKYAKRKTILWLIGIYASNVILALFISIFYFLFESKTDAFNNFMIFFRTITLALTGFAFFVTYRKALDKAKYLIFLILFINLMMYIYMPNKDFVIAVSTFTVTVIIIEDFFSSFFTNTKFTIIFGCLGGILLNGYAFYLVQFVSRTTNINYEILFVMNYLIVFISIFNVSSSAGKNRFTKYLSQLIYMDMKTGLHNEREFEHQLKIAINNKEPFYILSLHFSNLSFLNKRFTYRIVQHEYLNCIQDIKKIMSTTAESYKLEGPLIAFIIKENLHDIEDIQNKIHQINSSCNKNLKDNKQNKHMALNWLGTRFPDDGHSSEKLISNLYHLKDIESYPIGGIQWYDQDAYYKMKRQINLEKDLISAIENEGLEIALQPQFDLNKNTLHGVEVLARWTHKEHGIVSPVEFIPIVEQLNLAEKFTNCILDLSKKALLHIEANHIQIEQIAVNIIASNISDGSIITMIKNWPNLLELEITESTLMELNERAKATLSLLKEKGFSIAIDDFGTGFSNLEYLHALDVGYLKVDKKFIDSMMTSEKALKLVEALMSMAHTLNIKVIAEGVETKMQYDILKSLNCDIIQGYYYAKPMSVDAFIERFKPI